MLATPVEKFLRLLEVDNPVVLPIETSIRILITSSDVLHSWAIPSLGLKLDACPGRLNQVHAFILRTGVFYGQCSEICLRCILIFVIYFIFCKLFLYFFTLFL